MRPKHRDRGVPIGLALAGGTEPRRVITFPASTPVQYDRDPVTDVEYDHDPTPAPSRADLQVRADLLECARNVETNTLRAHSLNAEYRDVLAQLDAMPADRDLPSARIVLPTPPDRYIDTLAASILERMAETHAKLAEDCRKLAATLRPTDGVA